MAAEPGVAGRGRAWASFLPRGACRAEGGRNDRAGPAPDGRAPPGQIGSSVRSGAISTIATPAIIIVRLDTTPSSLPISRAFAVPTPWAVKGAVMRTVVEAAGARQVDLTDGVRVVEADGRWALVLPDPSEAVTHVWAEGADAAEAAELTTEWAEVVEATRP